VLNRSRATSATLVANRPGVLRPPAPARRQDIDTPAADRRAPMPGFSVEQLDSAGSPICFIYRVAALPQQTTFPTGPELTLQAGFVVHERGHEIPRHIHTQTDRQLTRTAEVLMVVRGRCEVDVFDEDRAFVATRELQQGDVLVMVRGGHGFRMLEDTVLFEVKQGPYFGAGEKELF